MFENLPPTKNYIYFLFLIFYINKSFANFVPSNPLGLCCGLRWSPRVRAADGSCGRFAAEEHRFAAEGHRFAAECGRDCFAAEGGRFAAEGVQPHLCSGAPLSRTSHETPQANRFQPLAIAKKSNGFLFGTLKRSPNFFVKPR